MHATETKRVELGSYQFNNVENIWYNQWEDGRGQDVNPAECSEFQSAFLGSLLSQELREAMIKEFVNVKQEGLMIKEYNLKFIQLSRYAPEMFQDMRSKIRKFISGLSTHMKKEYRATLRILNMDISRLMAYAQ